MLFGCGMVSHAVDDISNVGMKDGFARMFSRGLLLPFSFSVDDIRSSGWVAVLFSSSCCCCCGCREVGGDVSVPNVGLS